MIILGIDPGTSRIGFAFLQKAKDSVELLECGCLELTNISSQPERLKTIDNEISNLIKKYHPEVLAIEKLFFAKNTKTAMAVSEARGVLISASFRQGLQTLEFTPLEIKVAICGYGRAEKSQIQNMVMKILKLKKLPQPDDAADAIAVGLTACYTNKNLKRSAL